MFRIGHMPHIQGNHERKDYDDVTDVLGNEVSYLCHYGLKLKMRL